MSGESEHSDEKEVIHASDLYGYTHYLYGEAFLGSYGGMRYRVAREPLKKVFYSPQEEWAKDATFLVSVWPEPYSYEKTPDEKKQSFSFPFTDEGRLMAVKCLNRQYFIRKPEWDAAMDAHWI